MPRLLNIPANSKLSTYLKGSTAGLLAKALSVGSAFVNLWLLNRILSKDQFGSYAFSMTVVAIASLLFTLGQDRAIFYRLSGDKTDDEKIAGSALVYTTIRRILLANAVMLLMLLSIFSLDIGGLRNHSYWLMGLSAIIPVSVVNQILISWYQSQHRFVECVLVPRVEDISRSVLLTLVLLFWPGRTGTVWAIIVAGLLTLFVWYLLIPPVNFKSKSALSSDDFFYGLKLMLTKVAHVGLEKVDILLLGFMTSKLIIAEYSVGSKIALFAFIGNELLGPIFTPRMRKYIVTQESSSLVREYKQTRLFSLIFTLAVSVFILFSGPTILNFFGDYQGSQSILLILISGGIINMGYGPSGRYLNMAGHVSISLVLTILLLLGNAILCYLLIPILFGIGAALSTFFCLVLYNTAIAYFIWKKDRFPTIDACIMITVYLSCGGLILAALNLVDPTYVGLGIMLLILLQVGIERDLWLPLASNMF
jgi:O-antigen/teichoic acid export membrane protein